MCRLPLKPRRKPWPRKEEDSRFEVTLRSVSVSCEEGHQLVREGSGCPAYPSDSILELGESSRLHWVDTGEDHRLERLERFQRRHGRVGVMEGVSEVSILHIFHRTNDPPDHALAESARSDVGIVGDADLARGKDTEVEDGVRLASGGRCDVVACCKVSQSIVESARGHDSPFLISPSTTATSETTPRNES